VDICTPINLSKCWSYWLVVFLYRCRLCIVVRAAAVQPPLVGSGKTVTLLKIIPRIHPKPKNIIVFYSEEQPIYKQFPENTKFVKGWSDKAVEEIPRDSLVVLDDLMTQCQQSPTFSTLFTKISHHRKVSVIVLLQNLFPKSVYARDVSLNAQYILLFPNPRDQAQLRHLASQMFPGHVPEFIEIFKQATRPFHPLLLDLHQTAQDRIISGFLTDTISYYEF
jgi:hypothetical protein